MLFSLANTSVVVLAKDHNPSLLHPAFLSGRGIMGGDEELAEPSISTPALSLVKYASGLVFMVELNKLQITDNAPTEDTERPARLATLYLKELPHVRYVAIGLNFTGFVDHDRPEVFLAEKFLKPGPWKTAPLEPTAVGLKLAYPTDDWTLNMSLDAGSLTRKSGPAATKGVVISGNYHKDLEGQSPLREATDAISAFSERSRQFSTVAKTILGFEE